MPAKPFTQEEIHQIRETVPVHDKKRLLIEIGLSTLLRVADLRMLRWKDVLSKDGSVHEMLTVRLYPTLEPKTVLVLEAAKLSLLARAARKSDEVRRNAYLFNYWRKPDQAMTTQGCIKLIKSACLKAGVNPKDRSCHSLRKTIPTIIYENERDLPSIQSLLWARSESVVRRYLSIERTSAFDQMKRFSL